MTLNLDFAFPALPSLLQSSWACVTALGFGEARGHLQ
jgi:hypothetical protein